MLIFIKNFNFHRTPTNCILFLAVFTWRLHRLQSLRYLILHAFQKVYQFLVSTESFRLPWFEVAPKRFASRYLWPLLRESPQGRREKRVAAFGMGGECVPGNWSTQLPLNPEVGRGWGLAARRIFLLWQQTQTTPVNDSMMRCFRSEWTNNWSVLQLLYYISSFISYLI